MGVQGRFDGQVVIITGAARGIGDAIATAFATEGAQVVSLDLIDPPEPRPGVRYGRADVSDAESVRTAFEEIGQTEGRVDVLVNNAGIRRVGLVEDLDPRVWDDVVGTHLRGAYLCSARAIPFLRRAGRGAIVTIASTHAFLGLPGRAAYAASKAGLLALTRVLAVELARANIRVNAVAPGFTRTPMVEEALREGSVSEASMLERIPIGRLAEPAEIARVVCFLSSEDASYVTGQCVVVDGGWTIQGIGLAPAWLSGDDASGGS